MIEVLQPGLLTTIQDLGRTGYENYGMPPSGAFDPFLATVANKLVGNERNTPLLEFALVGPTLQFQQDCWLGIAGFSVTYLLNGKQVPEFSAFFASSGSVLQFAGMKSWFAYLAFNGGIQAEKILGSASTYMAGRIGDRLVKGNQIHVGEESGRHYRAKAGFMETSAVEVIHILPALHTGFFSLRERHKIAENEFVVSLQSNRMGIKLEGVTVEQPHVKRSAPALPGSIQVPRSGQPVILGPEGPTTGGYPQIAILTRTSWTRLAQTAPGRSIRFQWVEPEEARRAREYRDSIFTGEEAWERI